MKCLTVGALGDLLRHHRSGFEESRFDSLAVCHVADLFLAAERIRKGDDHGGTGRIREAQTAFHEGIDRGRLLVAQLDGFAIQKCLFEPGVDGQSLLNAAVAQSPTPEGSANALSITLLREQWGWELDEDS